MVSLFSKKHEKKTTHLIVNEPSNFRELINECEYIFEKYFRDFLPRQTNYRISKI